MTNEEELATAVRMNTKKLGIANALITVAILNALDRYEALSLAAARQWLSGTLRSLPDEENAETARALITAILSMIEDEDPNVAIAAKPVNIHTFEDCLERSRLIPQPLAPLGKREQVRVKSGTHHNERVHSGTTKQRDERQCGPRSGVCEASAER
jgi:hypothetical protein